MNRADTTVPRSIGTALVLLVGSACPMTMDPPVSVSTGSSGASTPSPSPSGQDSSTDTSAGAGTESSSGPMWPRPTDDDLLTCVPTCEFPSDCCPADSLGSCPGFEYPYNYACIDGLCVAPPCLADDDCPEDGAVCREVRGFPTCVLPCDGDDAPCAAVASGQTCSGVADDQSRYCFAHCTNPGVFCGISMCDATTGVCVCRSEGQCRSRWACV